MSEDSKTPNPPLSPAWSAQDRLRAIAALLPGMQADIYAGRYSAVGRPNVTSLQHLIADPAETLEGYRPDIERYVAEFEAKYPLPEGWKWPT
jgi:hypothetical protein